VSLPEGVNPDGVESAVAVLTQIANDPESRDFDRRGANRALIAMGLVNFPASQLSLIEVVREIDALQNIGDSIDSVRGRASETAWAAGDTETSNWDLPSVRRYGELCARLYELLKMGVVPGSGR